MKLDRQSLIEAIEVVKQKRGASCKCSCKCS
jgi:hypothetical protein